MRHRFAERTDTLIGALWSIGMAAGVLLVKLTPGYHSELLGYLFGNISFASQESLWLLAALDVVIVATTLLFHKRFLAICLDAEQAELQRSRCWPPRPCCCSWSPSPWWRSPRWSA